MSTAKTQPSAGQSDGSDDLIAELARMMATDAQPAMPVAESVEPTLQEPAPQPQQAAPAAVRIPGPPENAPSGGKFDFDFGAAPKTAEALTPAPLVNWQERFNKPVEHTRQEPVAQSARQEPVVEQPRHEPVVEARVPTPPAPVETAYVPTPPPAREPVAEAPASFIAPPRPVAVEPAPQPVHVEPAPQPVRAVEPAAPPRAEVPRVPVTEEPQAEPARSEPVAFTTHDFDFGFGTARISEPVSANEPAPEPQATPDTHDAIADLIAADFDVPDTQASVPSATAESAPAPILAPAAHLPAAEPPAPKPFLRATNFATQPKPQSDRFAVSPVFGVGSQAKPAAAAPAPAPVPEKPAEPAQIDPMDEIESLIGSSIRHDASSRIETRGPASPILQPREATPIPRATARPIRDDHGADAAILAAAAASGAEVGRVQQSRADDRVRLDDPRPAAAPKPPRAARKSTNFRPLIGLGVAAALLIVAGGGLYWVLGNGQGGADGTAPVLTADTGPVKEPPPQAPASTTDQPASVVLNELSGANGTAQVPEQLVSRDQAGDTAAVAAVAPTEPVVGDEGLANRKVRTVTVRPDGTIVNADDVLAGTSALPVTRPDVPAVPSTGLDASDLLTAAADANASTPAPLTTTPAAAQPATALAPNPVIDPANITPPGTVAPVPKPRLTNRPTAAIGPSSGATNAVNAVVAANDPIGALAAQATQAATPTPAPQASSGTPAPAYVQLSSQRDENVARQSLIEINQRFGKMLGGVLPEVQRVDLGAKGIYYRVRVPADSMQSANQLCDQIKSARGECFVTN